MVSCPFLSVVAKCVVAVDVFGASGVAPPCRVSLAGQWSPNFHFHVNRSQLLMRFIKCYVVAPVGVPRLGGKSTRSGGSETILILCGGSEQSKDIRRYGRVLGYTHRDE